jgi:hypothetical protein
LRVDVVPVDWVREAICTVLDAPDADGRCFHLTDPFALTLGEWFDLLAERLGLVRIPGQLPLGPARAVWRADLVRPVRDLLDQGADLPPEALSAFVTEAVFDTTQAERLLRPLGLTPPHAPSWAPTLIERAGALLS